MPLDSDISNADAQLRVEFYTYDKDGPWKGKPYVRIVVPGDKTNVIDQPAREDHKRRFQRQWLFYQANNSDGQIIGIPLTEWQRERPEELSDGQLMELTILKFQTVEQLALASDTQVARVGMGAAGLRERARMYLAGKNAKAGSAELEQTKRELAELKALVAGLSANQNDTPKRRAGWPKGKKRTPKNKGLNDGQHAPATGAASL